MNFAKGKAVSAKYRKRLPDSIDVLGAYNFFGVY